MAVMFKLEGAVDGKRVADTLIALAAVGAYDVKVVPMINVEVRNGQLREKQGDTKQHTVAQIVWAAVRSKNDMTVVDARNALAAAGKKISNATYAMQQLAKGGHIKRIGNTNKYKVAKR